MLVTNILLFLKVMLQLFTIIFVLIFHKLHTWEYKEIPKNCV